MKTMIPLSMFLGICTLGMIFVQPILADGSTSVECECRIEPSQEYGTFKTFQHDGEPVEYCVATTCFVRLKPPR
ncbi:MAG: hypothetical protein QNK37_18170 [Acidobacteriota bacterium]|nr:hypothetical protein [Acidobacteriota bacterium]